MRRLALLAALAVVGLVLACDGGEDGARTATPTPSASGTPAARLTMTPTPAATQAPVSPTLPIPLEEGAAVTDVGLHLVETATGRLWRLEGSGAWSPDGKSLARWNCCMGQGGLDVIDVPTGPAVRVFNGDVSGAAWSPDGTQIAFSSYGQGPEGVYVVNSDGSGLRQLWGRGTHAVGWSASGDRFAFARGERIYLLHVPSGEVTDVAQRAHDLAWSPDGTTLAFTDDTGLYVYDPDTGERRQIAVGPSGGPILWSPDGSRIAFPFGPRVPMAYGGYAGDAEVGLQIPHVVEVEGSTEPKPLPPARYPSWSPDGTKIAFLSEGCITGEWDIYTVAPDGSSEVRLTSTPETVKEGPYWSPTGATIAFSTFGELILLDAESGEMQTLVESGWPETTGRDIHLHGAVWSPDGRYIQFTVGTAHGICD
jgi:Tol biopolymer transport system component